METNVIVKTAGEMLFEELTTARGYNFERIETTNLPTADYKIHTSPSILVCEVKDFGEDQLSIKQQQAFEHSGTFATNYNPEQRLRRRIANAWQQLCQYPDDAIATILFSQSVIPYETDIVCKNHLPNIFTQFSLMSAVIVIEKVKPQIISNSKLQLSSREIAEIWYKELLQPWQIRARVYKNVNATNQFPTELFCDQPDETISLI